MLIDSYARKINYLRLSLTDQCDLRCKYCIPMGFKNFEHPESWLTFSEIKKIINIFASLGITNIRLTGGEPLLRKNLPSLIKNLTQIKGIENISLTTNGTQLSRLSTPLKQSGLKNLNISLDTLDKIKFKEITGYDSFDKVLSGILQAKKDNFQKIKINMVLMQGVNDNEIKDMILFCLENKLILRIIELMPIGQTSQNLNSLNLKIFISNILQEFELVKSNKVLGNGPAQYWQTKDGQFFLGLIMPLSENFCENCNRLRITVTGNLILCLGQNNTISLKNMLRAGYGAQKIKEEIIKAVKLKPKSHEFTNKPKKIIKIMSMIGG